MGLRISKQCVWRTQGCSLCTSTSLWAGSSPPPFFADFEMGWAGGQAALGPCSQVPAPIPGHFQATPQEDVENPPAILGEPERQQRVQQLVSPRSKAGGNQLWAGLPSHMRSPWF